MLKNTLKVAFGLCLLFQIYACGEKPVFYQEIELPENVGWAYANKLSYKVAVSDTAQHYDLYLDVTHSDVFPTQNIYYRVHTTFPDGKTKEQMLNFDFFDKAGKPHGKCSGGYCLSTSILRENLYFNQTGDYTFSFEQYSRGDSLSGIKSVALRLMKHAAAQAK